MLGQLPIINIDFYFNSVPTHQLYWEELCFLNIDSVQKKKKKHLFVILFTAVLFQSRQLKASVTFHKIINYIEETYCHSIPMFLQQ